jgi:hypothetical protein
MTWVIEDKGMPTPDWKIKFKLYKEWMKYHHPKCKIFVAHGVGDVERIIKILKEDNENRQEPIKRTRNKKE